MTDSNAYQALEEASGKKRISDLPPSRTGKRAFTTWHDPAVLQQLKMVSAKTGKSHQMLSAEALNLLFESYGEKPIA